MKRIAILQSNYIPWRGYFDLIAAVDEFVILDSVQYTKNDWRNRNRIPTPRGPAWLTIPIRTAGRFAQKISEAEVADPDWADRHWRTIARNYGRSARLENLRRAYEDAARETQLSRINRLFIDVLCRSLDIGTAISRSQDYPDRADRVERLIGICQAARAATYVSGPRARAYLDTARFAAEGIAVEFFEYRAYGSPPFSAIDAVLSS